MKRFTKVSIVVLIVLFSILLLSACNGEKQIDDYQDKQIDEHQYIISYIDEIWTDGKIEISIIDIKIDKWLYSQYSNYQEGYNDDRKFVCFKMEVKNLTDERITFGMHHKDYKLSYTSGDVTNALSIFECSDAWGKRIGGWMPIRKTGEDTNYYDDVIGVSLGATPIYNSIVEPKESRVFMNAFVTKKDNLEESIHSISILQSTNTRNTLYKHLGRIVLQNYEELDINSYEITLIKNIIEAGTVEGEGIKEYNSERTITAETNEGYTWLGWFYGEVKVSTGDSLSYTFTMPAENKIFEARWMLCPIILTKNIETAGTVSGVEKTIIGALTTITAETNLGYTWLGWYDGETKVSTDDSLTYTFNLPSENKTYEGRWEANEGTLYFNANVGEGVINNIVISSGENLPLNTFTKTNYYFAGWSLTADGDVVYSDEEVYIVIEDGVNYTLYAQWRLYARTGNYIWFGEYPQTIKEASVTVGDTADSDGYFLGSDGARYAKVVASPYSPYHYTFSTGASVTSGTTYYFKVERVKWRILEESGGEALILAELILDNHRYAESSNNYMNSEVRAWLNNQFYNTAFNDLQQHIILTTNVDNSLASTGDVSNPYACEDTNDKVFILSRAEALNASYGFSSSTWIDIYRVRLTSDYSRSKGVYMDTNINTYYGNGYWWLRSPSNFSSNSAHFVDISGYIDLTSHVSSTSLGLVPALKIQL